METVYQLKSNELTLDFYSTLKKRFDGRDIKITVEEEQDETEYLLSDPLNRELLLAGIKAGKEGRFSHVMTFEEAEALAE